MINNYGGMNGRVQAHVEGYHKDYNRQNILSVLWYLGGRYLIVVNDWELARDWMALGGIALLRLKGEGIYNDDDHDARGFVETYVNTACDLLGKAEADLPPAWRGRGMVYLGNELGSTNPERQDDYGYRGIKAVTARGRGVVFGNWSIQNPDDDPATPILEHFSKLPKTIAALQENARLYDGRMGFHEGTDKTAPTVAEAIAQGKIGRFIEFQKQYGVKVWITEFTGSENAHEGWRTLYGGDWQKYGRVIDQATAEVYDPYDAIVSIFTLGEWSVGNNFGFMHDLSLQAAIMYTNGRYPLKESTVRQAKMFYAPAYICPWLMPETYRLLGRGDEACKSVLMPDGVIEFRKNAQCEEKAVFDGFVWIGKDTSDLYTPDGKQNGEYYIPYSQKPLNDADRLKYYFSKWIPEWVYEGLEYTRNVYVERCKADGTILPEGQGTGWHKTTIRVVKHHPTYYFTQSQLSLPNVLQLHVDGVQEDYLYALNYGLVGHLDLATGKGSYFGGKGGVILSAAVTRKHPRPAVPKPPAAYPLLPPVSADNTLPAPSELGTPQEYLVGTGSALVSNLRSIPDADGADAGKVVGSVKIGDRVKASPNGWRGNGYTWRVIYAKNGVDIVPPVWLASVAVLVAPPAPPEPVLKLVSRPIHVSQIGTTADLRQNDCGMAAVQASALRKLAQRGYAMPLLEVVDNLIPVSPIATVDAPVGVQGMINFAKLLGVELIHTIFTEAKMLAELDSDMEFILLGNYGHLKPGERKVGHWFTVVGYTANGWIINDPLYLGAQARITREAMVKVQTDLDTYQIDPKTGKPIQFAGAAYQGFIVR